MIEHYDLVDKWIASTLSTDATLVALTGGRIGSDLSSETWIGDYLTWSAQSTRMIRSISGEMLDSDSLFAIVARTQGGSFGPAVAISSRVRALLDNRSATVTGGSISCFMESSDRLAETVKGVPYRNVGGLYRIRAVSI